MGVQVQNALFFQMDSQSSYRCACFGWTHLKRHCLQAEQFSSKISSIFDHRVRDSSLIESYYHYGTEQAFDGSEDEHDYRSEPQRFAEDRYVREAMFGGACGAFETTGCHFFNPTHPTYVRIATIARLRNRDDFIGKALRRGRLYARETSYLEYPFSLQKRGELVAWSQMLLNTEVLIALNTNAEELRGAEVTVDNYLHPDGSTMTFLYRNDWSDAQLCNPPLDQATVVRHQPD